jgi:glycosyltransferase involved in cell wall biosynthesis
LKILLSTYACDPGTGSESGLGWNWMRQIARLHEVWVLTQTKERHRIEMALAKDPLPNAHCVFADLPSWTRFWKRKGSHWGENVYYYIWQIWAYLTARRLHQQVHFDLVHHVTFVRYWMPSFLALLPVPFIWGPVGASESVPDGFLSLFSLRGRLNELFRALARLVGELDPFVRVTAKKAMSAFATTEATKARMKRLGCRQVVVYSEAGLTRDEISRLSNLPFLPTQPFRVISIGRLIQLKGFELSLRAFAEFRRSFPGSEYWLIGDGPERKRLTNVVENLKIGDCVRFWGSIPRYEVFEKLSECNTLVHPSLHESGGWVCLEAMAAGRPVVCLDWAGPAVQVTPETGIKILPISPDQVVKDLATAMTKLASEPEFCRRLGQEGRRRIAEHFDWETKADFMLRIYESALGSTTAESQQRSLDSMDLVKTSRGQY